MKSLFWKIIMISALPLFWACQNRTSTNEKTEKDQGSEEPRADIKTLSLPYIATINDTTSALEMQRNPERSKIALNKEELAEALNLKYPDIKLQLGDLHHDTLDIHIPEATPLTQQYGTTGALTYLAEATYAFTDLPKIKVVNFDFKEGDHAVPGPYTRESFKKSL